MKLDPEEIRRLTKLLEAMHEDRRLLVELSDEDRVAFLTATGKVALPEKTSLYRLKKAQRNRRAKTRRDKDKQLRDDTGIRVARAAPVFTAPALPAHSETQHEQKLLEIPADCYVCKREYRRVHHFYDSMCWECGELNYKKRFQATPGLLEGKVALITGARVKIGYQASLMLLRSGAAVIATTRFPHDAVLRYEREPDYSSFKDRLQIHGLDLRHAPSVEMFALHVARTHGRLDIVINNAAQTVRRPPGWYRHLIDREHALPDSPLLASHKSLVESLSGRDALTSWRSHDPALGIHSSAELSLLPYHMEQSTEDAQHFPQGRLDADLQQIDMRAVNSWRLRLGEVATAEMLEVHLVNAVAPFILCGKLRPLMERDRSKPGHVVNVSAMEGSFSRGTKTDKHPHTNMAKAALNMMTLTSAPDYLKSNIYMNAVDTGWVTDEDPHHHSERKRVERDFSPPLDIVDGAARVVDPVLDAERTGNYVSGLFLKDYAPTKW